MNWQAKTPGETRRYRWEPALLDSETISSVSGATDSGTVTLTLTSEVEDGREGVTVLVAGGAAGETARISIDAVTSEGQTLSGVFFLPVRDEAPTLGNTVRDVVTFALRKIVGNGEAAEAEEAEAALEWLNGMILDWRLAGVDVGVSKTLELSDTLAIPDAFVSALKWNLRALMHAEYDVALSGADAMAATSTKRAVTNAVLDLQPLGFEAGLRREGTYWNFTRGY